MFSPGTTVEVSSKINNKEVVWVPAVVIKEFKEDDEYKYIVRVYDKSFSCKGNKAARLNKTVDLCSLRPTPPSISVEEYQLKEYVEVFHVLILYQKPPQTLTFVNCQSIYSIPFFLFIPTKL